MCNGLSKDLQGPDATLFAHPDKLDGVAHADLPRQHGASAHSANALDGKGVIHSKEGRLGSKRLAVRDGSRFAKAPSCHGGEGVEEVRHAALGQPGRPKGLLDLWRGGRHANNGSVGGKAGGSQHRPHLALGLAVGSQRGSRCIAIATLCTMLREKSVEFGKDEDGRSRYELQRKHKTLGSLHLNAGGHVDDDDRGVHNGRAGNYRLE
mmetsp:Transcript_4139/g.13460  ORF Transcript_4139/g.13460 Transcript_4139/m.13460 type:complete len:208 (-) Transcript_4139:353-976(-)